MGGLQDRRRAVAVLHRRRMHLQFQGIPVGIDQSVTLAAIDFLAGIVAMRATRLGALDVLGIDDSGTGTGLAADTLPVSFHQLVVQAFPGAVVTKPGEPAIGCLA